MPSVGTAYVNVRIDTKSFTTSLESTMARLSKKMEAAGTQFGKDFDRGMKKTNFDSAFKPLTDAASKAETKVGNSFDGIGKKSEDAVTRIESSSEKAQRSLGELGDASHRAQNSMGGLGKAASNANRSLNSIGRGGGGSALRSAANDAGFFRSKLNELSSEAARGRKILAGLYDAAAFGGTAMAGLAGGLSAAAQGIFAIGANAAAAVPALSVLSSGLVGLAQVGSVIGISMKGVGEALSAGFKDVAPTASAASGAAKGLGKAGNDAAKGIADAVAAAARAVRDAKQNLKDAYADAARSAADAARTTLRAEQDLAAAQRDSLAAQKALNAARKEAKEQLEDIGFAAEDAALAQKRAGLDLQDAYAQLQEVSELPPDDRARQEAELSYKEAELHFREAKDARQDADKEQRQAAKNGIEGTDAMIDAHNDVADAQEREADASQALADARRSEAETAIDNAKSIRDAQQALADAERALADARKKGGAAQAANTAGVAAGTAAIDDYAEALKKLSPNQRAFVEYLVSMKDKFSAARKEIADPLFGGLNLALHNIIDGGLFDQLVKDLTGTSTALGDVIANNRKGMDSFGELAKNPAFKKSLSDTMKSNNGSIHRFGQSAVYLADAFVQVADAASPLLEDFSKWTLSLTKGWSETSRAKNATGELGDTFQTAETRVREFWGLTKELWRTLTILGTAANEAANGFGEMDKKGKAKGYIPSLTDSLDKFNDELEKNPDLVSGFSQSLSNLNAAGAAVKTVTQPLIKMGQDKGLQEAFKTISDSDAFARLGDTAGDAVPELADLVVNIADFFAAMSESGSMDVFLGSLSTVSGLVAKVANGLSKIKFDIPTGPFGDGSLNLSILKVVGAITGTIAATRIMWKVFKIGASPFVGLAKGANSFRKTLQNIGTRFTNLFRGSDTQKEIPFPKTDTKLDPAEEAKAEASGRELSSDFAKGLREGMTEVESAMEAVELKVRESFSEISKTGAVAAAKAGRDIMEGLEIGLREGTAEASAQALKAGAEVARDVGKGAGTASPSKITMPYGADIMEGLEVGIREGTVEAQFAAEAAGAKVATAVGSGTEAAQTSVIAAGENLGDGVTTGVAGGIEKGTKGGKITGSLGRMGKVFSGAGKVMSGAMRGIGGAMNFMMGPWGLLIMTLLPILMPLLIKLNDKFHIMDKVMAGLKWTLDILVKGFTWLWDKLKALFGWIKSNWPYLVGALFGPFGIAIALILKHWDTVLAFIKSIPGKVTAFLKGMWESITDSLKTVWSKTKKFFTTIFNFIKSLPQRYVNMLKGLWNILFTALRIAFTKIKSVWTSVTTWVKGRPRQFATNMKLIWDILKTALTDAFTWIKDKFITIGTYLAGRPAQFVRNLKGLWDAIKDGLRDAWDWVTGKWTDIKGAIAKWPGQIKDTLSKIWNGLGIGLIDAVNWVGDKVNWMVDKINGVTSKFGGPKISVTWEHRTWTGFAAGGPVRGPGGPRDDKIPARLSNGEHVWTAREVAAMGGHRNVIALRKSALKGEQPGIGGLFGSIVSGVKSVGSAIANGAEYAIKYVIGKFVEELPDTFIGNFVGGMMENAADKFVGWGEHKDEEIARRNARLGKYTGPPGGWTYPLAHRYGITQYPNAGHSPSWAVDIGAPGGTAVRAASRGLAVTRSLGNTSYGNYVVISHAGGQQTLYAHLRSFAIRSGTQVKTGQLIGYSDSTGNSTGNHLHFELKPSSSTITAMAAHGVKLGKGGVVAPSAAGTLAVLAEAGQHERVTPLDPEGFTPAERRIIETLEAKMGGGGGDQYHVHPSRGMDEARLADLVARRVKWQRRRGAGR